MKAKVIIAFLFSIVTASQPAFTAAPSKVHDDEPPHVSIGGVSPENAHVLADFVAVPPVSPRGPCDLLHDYELEIASIATQLSVDLEVISNVVEKGQITRTARTPAVPTDPTLSSTGDEVLVAMPFSSLQLSPTLVEYLGLTRTQAKAIQKWMDRERPTTEPLMDALRIVSAELGVAIRQNQSNDNEAVAQSLAATQARLLKQLMMANSRLQRRIDDVLGSQQRKKLDALRHTAEVSVVHGS